MVITKGIILSSDRGLTIVKPNASCYRHEVHHSFTISNIALSPRYLIALRQNFLLSSIGPLMTDFSNKSNHILGYSGFVFNSSLSSDARFGNAMLGAGVEMVFY